MKVEVGRPTRRVLLRGPLDLVRHGTGDVVRGEIVVDAFLPVHDEGEVQPFARLRRANQHETSSFLAVGDRTLSERPAPWSRSCWHDLPRHRLEAVSPLVFHPYEYLMRNPAGRIHLDAGQRFAGGVGARIEVVSGRPIQTSGYRADLRNDAIVEATAARMRAEAASGILLAEDAVFVCRHLPRWQMKRHDDDPRNLVLELVDYSPRPEEHSFRIDRRDAGVDLMNAAAGADCDVDGEILEWDAAAVPAQEDDLVRLAAKRAPETTSWTGMTPDRMPGALVRAWHDVRNAAGIVADGGRPAAERILGQTLQLLDHRRALDGETWSQLRARIALEGISAPGSAHFTGMRP